MAQLTNISTSSLSNQNIASALLIHTFTNTTRLRKIYIDVFVDQIAGNGNYVIYATRQRSGAGSAYEVGARTTVSVPSGVTAQHFPTIALTAGATDVIKVYLLGLAGDTTTPDTIVDVSEEYINVDASGNPTPNDSAGITTLLARIVGTLLTGNHNPQTGDAYARLGAAGSGLTSIPNSAGVTTILADYARRTGDYSTLTAATLRTAIGMAAANLDTQLAAILAGAASPPTPGVIADAVWDELLAGHVISGSAGSALNAVGGVSGIAILTTFTVNDVTNQPLDGVLVEISTDAAKLNVIASGYTLTNGIVSLNLDPGAYYLWKNLAGYDFQNPEIITVS